MISFIVSTCERSKLLTCVLTSLHAQTVSVEVLVADNSGKLEEVVRDICMDFGARYFNTRAMGARECYESSDMLAKLATGDFLCFASDDGYYVPVFAETMERKAVRESLDLVYCDMVWGHTEPRESYVHLDVIPVAGRIDKTGFIVRRELFKGFPGMAPREPSCDDGRLVEQLIAAGARHGKVNEILVVHS